MEAGANEQTSLLSQEEKENLTRKKVILVVDDSVEYLRVLTKMLEVRYNLALAKSGKDAIHIVMHSPVDLILLDIEMPGMTGLELLNIIGRNPVYSTLPVIFVTSHAQSDMITRAAELGAKGYLVKPFHEQALLNKIAQVMSSSPGKMAAIHLSRQLINMENALIEIQETLKDASDPVDAFLKAKKIRQDTLKAYDRILAEGIYSTFIEVHLTRMYFLIKHEDNQALSRLREFINSLGVRNLAVGFMESSKES
jgi:CheY-like chemotaxis protein